MNAGRPLCPLTRINGQEQTSQWPAHVKAIHLEIGSDIRQTIEAPLPGNMRMPFDTLKKVFSSAGAQANPNSKPHKPPNYGQGRQNKTL